MSRLPLLLCATVALALAAPAAAVAPSLTVGVQPDRHATATFSAPHADYATIYFASKPDRATNGDFYSENIVTSDSLTDDELAAGRWVDDSQIDPGRYFVILEASPDFDRCYIYGSDGAYDPACAQGHSNVAVLNVPKPAVRYSVGVTVLKFLGQVDATIKATPLGEDRPYKVCYRAKSRKQRCLRSKIDGYDWGSASSDSVDISTRLMPARTTLTWFVNGRRVASKTIRVR